MQTILVTGATGFIGRSLLPHLKSANYRIRALSRHPITELSQDIEWLPCDLVTVKDYGKSLADVDTVIHLAARVHKKDIGNNAATLHHQMNTEATQHLATQSAYAGVRRFIFLSTIGVNGNKSELLTDGKLEYFTERHGPRPHNAYSASKHEAEIKLQEICTNSSMEYVILRPPLIYGPGVKANFLRLMEIVARGIPLPLGSVKNKRSLLYVDNLSLLIEKCIYESQAANQTYLVSDFEIGVPELIRKIGDHLGRRYTLFPFPVALLKLMGKITRKQGIISSLTDSLVIDNSKVKQDLSWSPRFGLEDGLLNTLNWYKVFHSGYH